MSHNKCYKIFSFIRLPMSDSSTKPATKITKDDSAEGGPGAFFFCTKKPGYSTENLRKKRNNLKWYSSFFLVLRK